MTVLIVEDNYSVRRLLRQVLAEAASEIWDCSDGADALAVYGAHRPDVVLMDIHMPRMDGLAATKEIVQAHPDAMVVIVTDYDDEALRAAAHEAGACGYLLKVDVIDLPELLPEIRTRP